MMMLTIYLGVICTFLISKVHAQNTSDFLALLNTDDQNITCITSDSRKAMSIIYPLEYANQVKEKENRQRILLIRSTFDYQSNLEGRRISPTIIFDERWNGFNNSQMEYNLREEDPILPLSVRGTNYVELYFLFQGNTMAKLTINDERSDMEFYDSGGTVLTTNAIQLKKDKWTTFILKFNNVNKKKLSLTYKLENGKELSFGKGRLPNEFRVSKIEIAKTNNSLIRIHEHKYFYSNVEANYTIRINSTENESCFTIYTALCSTCCLTFSFQGEYLKICKKKMDKQLWQINDHCIKNDKNYFAIMVQTHITKKTESEKLFWAISLLPKSEYKSISFKFKGDSNTFSNLLKENKIKCQIVGEENEIRINPIYNVIDDVEECPSPFTFGPNCSLSCKMLSKRTCYGTRLLTSSSQFCPAGYVGKYCRKECNEPDDYKNYFGQNCKHECGKCKQKCNSVNGHCESFRPGIVLEEMEKCESEYAGDKCNINRYPTVYNKPTLRVLNSTSIEVIIKNLSYFGYNEPYQYQIQYRGRRRDSPGVNLTNGKIWETYNKKFNLSYNESIFLCNLKVATSYDVRIILLDAQGNGNFSESVPFDTETTPCKGITETNIESRISEQYVSVTYTNVFIRFNLDNDNCPLDEYHFDCNTKRYNAINETTVHFKNLKHYENYTMAVRRKDDEIKLFSHRLTTKASAPPPILVAEIYARDDYKLHLRWKPPYPPYGEISEYILYINYEKSYISKEKNGKFNNCKFWEDYVCHEHSTKYNFLTLTQIAAKNLGVNQESPYTSFNNNATGIPSEPRNVSVSMNNNMELEIRWLHPLYPRSSTLSIFAIKLDEENIVKRSFGNQKEYYYTIENWQMHCGKCMYIKIYAIYERKYEKLDGKQFQTKYTFPSCRNLMINIPDTQLEKFVNDSVIIKVPSKYNTQYTRNVVILARSKTADQIPQFKFDNCSSFVGNLTENFIQKIKPVVHVKYAERCWNIPVTGSNLKEWIIYNKSNQILEESSFINIELFIINSYDVSYHYVGYFKLKADVSLTQETNISILCVLILLSITIILLLITVIWYRRNISTKIEEFVSKINSPFEDNRSDNTQMIPLTQNVTPLSPPRKAKKFIDANKISANPIHISSFKQYVKEALETGELQRQHQLFIRGQTKPWSYGVRPENKHKNRYTNLIAYDETRVILQKIDNDPFSDYINANYIDGYRHERAYIATQGPKQQTINDFWRMIWQEGSIVIIMLANIRESGKKKCEQYWPNINEESVYGNIRVFQEDTIVHVDYTCRKFKVTLHGESRQVEQFHFVSWPDHGVPMYAKSLLPLARKLYSIPYKTPIVIHCSAGVGRTGTIILTDIMFRMAKHEEQVDVLYYLKHIRDQRPNLVDNSDQYILVHLVIVEGLLTQQTNIPCEKLEQRFETLLSGDYISKQMEQIDEYKWMHNAMTKPSQHVTFNENTKQKNRFSDIVPIYTNDLIYLTPQKSVEGSEYINAVFVDGYRCKEKFIVTQQPLPNTLGDFWRLVVEQEIKFIVSLNKFNPNDETVVDICPPVNCEIRPMPHLKIKYIRKTNSALYNLIIVKINCNSKFINASQEDYFVQIIQLKQWCASAPLPRLSKRDFIQFWQDVNKICEDNITLVTCYDGALASGLFTAISFIIEQLDFEHECDISLAVRTIRHNRPNFIRSEEQFKYLYEIAISYVDSFSTYSNFQN